MVFMVFEQQDVEGAIRKAVRQERERCAQLAEGLAELWDKSAAKMRAKGTYTTRALWPFLKLTTHVYPRYEEAARQFEMAANGIREAILNPVRKGWAPLSEQERAQVGLKTRTNA
jgi:hypothetical protein